MSNGIDSCGADKHSTEATILGEDEVQGYTWPPSTSLGGGGSSGQTVGELVQSSIAYLNGYWTALQNCGHRQF
jgi:hypothetical protein